MKPILLKMTAFGPYKNEETIDFTKLEERKLFVISGTTGAGKTTIFDAICFALYGTASGQDRNDTKMLRSDFANDDVHTEVEFVFEIRGKKYRVLRRLPHVKKGRKTATGEKYELFEIQSGQEIPTVERQRVSDINKKLEEIIGLTYDQFSQIVMLPQGEFRKLLTSKTENKEEILRKIFKTSRYGEMAEKLEERKRQADLQLNEAKALKNSYIDQIKGAIPIRDSLLFTVLEQNSNVYQILEGLEEEQQYYQEKIKEDEKQYQEAFKEHQIKYERFVANQKLNEQLDELEKKKEKLAYLQTQIPFYEELKKTYDRALRASRISPVHAQFEKLKQEKVIVETKFENVKHQLAQAKENLLKAEETFKQEALKENEREKANEKVRELEKLVPIFQQIEKQGQLVHQLLQQKTTLQTVLQQLENEVTEKKAAIKKLQAENEQLEQSTESLNDLIDQLRNLREIVEMYHQYHDINKTVSNLQSEFEKALQVFNEAKRIYEVEESKWLNNQAAILASNLQPGMPCPVCGSTEHPSIHKEEVESASQETLKELKKQLEKREQAKYTSEANLVAKQNQLNEVKEQLLKRNATLKDEQQFIQQLNETIARVKEKEREKEQLAANKKQLKAHREQLETLEDEQKNIEQQFNLCNEKYTEEKTVLEQQRKSIPEDMQELPQLQQALQKAEKQKLELKLSWEKAQKDYQESKTAVATNEEALKQTTELLQIMDEKVQQSQKEFQASLVDAGFVTIEEFLEAKRTDSEQQKMQQQYDHFSKELHFMTQQVQEESEKLKGKEKVDLSDGAEELTLLKAAYEKALDTLNYSKACIQHCIDFAEKIETIANKIFEMEEKANQIVDLYNLLRGQNSKKISFERYVQMGYLEQITEAANIRLKNLSNGQYYLQVSDRLESHGRQSGLSLDVYDTYTGQARDVKTLSGGEKFNASLSLALGMADVIQSFQGNIDIETMFIDEGFGSLDEESLMKAIDTLIELQKSGRMIGVISHVQELKTAMPAILQVEKLKEGYSKTSIILK